mmetsp:Transcript_26883/g.75396  ORF Transcript_26883/g.75396 Transcript_26883/m.75396 type:complete len:238 (-) Transcript_26883:1914-2627(-)|eukprot:scaffold222953_cov32-Tisochrysis_lutea.AAC.2
MRHGTLNKCCVGALGENFQTASIDSRPCSTPAAGETARTAAAFLFERSHSNATGRRDGFVIVMAARDDAPTQVLGKKRRPLCAICSDARDPAPRSCMRNGSSSWWLSTMARLCSYGAMARGWKRTASSCADPLVTTPAQGTTENVPAGSGATEKCIGVSPSLESETVWYATSPAWQAGKLSVRCDNRGFEMKCSRSGGKVWPCAVNTKVHGGVMLFSLTRRKLRIVLKEATHSRRWQ